MDPELKTHLEKMEERINKKADDRSKDILDVIKDVADNTSQIMEKLDEDITSHTERIGALSTRVDYLEEKVLK